MKEILKIDTNSHSSQQAGEPALKLLVLGFKQFELQLLDTLVKLSKRRQPQLELLDVANGDLADVVMIDATDTNAMKWVGEKPWLKQKVTIWIDAPDVPGYTVVRRPVQWPSLPIMLARVLEQASLAKAHSSVIPTENGSVLIVDDSIAVRGQLRSLLELRGLSVTDVDSAEAAIRSATTTSFDCILMDVIMPGIDGYAACRSIKSNSRSGNKTPIIMLTSRSSPFDRIRGKMAGCDAYLVKPVVPTKLYEAISHYIALPADTPTTQQRSPQPYYL